MDIRYDERERVFRLDTDNMTYAMNVADEEGFLGHLHLGARLGDDELNYLAGTDEAPWLASKNARDRGSFLDSFPQECPGDGVGDFRSPAVRVKKGGRELGVQPLYESYRIYEGKEPYPGLPSVFGEKKDTKTLEITLRDKTLGLKLILKYTIFDGIDAVVRSAEAVNESDEVITVNRLFSMSVDIAPGRMANYLTLNGSWARERRKQILPIGIGTQSASSMRGISSHQTNPFIGLLSEGAGQDRGEVIGVNFIYSGNFIAQVERSQFDSLRLQMGIHPMGFSEELEPGGSFQSPEAVIAWSGEGIGAMTRAFHELYRRHLIRSPWLHRERPVLINNWEATFFDFDMEKLLKIARRAKKEGIELLVMDDGWFGHRDSDNSSLGDWHVNEKKLPGGVKRLADELKAMDMKLGIWFEPEMISPDSELYRAHPDWAFSFDGRTPCMSREQYVLDLTRSEIRDAIFKQMAEVLDSADIAYVKWDMNRPLTDVASHAKGAENGGSLFHHYVLGVYELQERLIKRYPELLIENCSGGGARFDPGMLFYSPQIWTSDDTDAIERLVIQEGTAMLYPLSSMGAHISVSPSQAVGRAVPMTTRGHVALAGTFGYELDINAMPDDDAALISEQVALYHSYSELYREGAYYRLASWQDNHLYDAYMVIAKDKSRALLTWVQVMGEPNVRSKRIRLGGLDPLKSYRVKIASPGTDDDDFSGNHLRSEELQSMAGVLDKSFTGATLMGAGIPMPKLRGDFRSVLVEFEEVN